MDATELYKQIRRIELKTKSLSHEWFAGQYHSAFKGRGMAFSEVREYQYGDDVRNIDWNVTARMDRPHVKVYEEEREINLTLIVDVSGSSAFTTGFHSKRDYIASLTATLAFSAIENNDTVGVIFFSDKIESVIPYGKSHKQVMRIIKEVLSIVPESAGSDIAKALEYYLQYRKQRSVCVLISDFRSGNYEKQLKVAASKHDLIGIQVFDPGEKDIPDIGLVPATDPETGRFLWLDTSDPQVRNQYRTSFDIQTRRFKEIFKKYGSDYLQMDTSESYARVLTGFFQSRQV